MSSEFQQLAEKVNQLAKLAQSLRNENAELRHHVKTLTDENSALNGRIDEAYARVSTVLGQLPAPIVEEPAETIEETT